MCETKLLCFIDENTLRKHLHVQSMFMFLLLCICMYIVYLWELTRSRSKCVYIYIFEMPNVYDVTADSLRLVSILLQYDHQSNDGVPII